MQAITISPVLEATLLANLAPSTDNQLLRETVELAYRDGFIAHVDLSTLTPDTDLVAAGMDSLDALVFLIELERKFSVSFADEEMQAVRSFNDCVKLITAHRKPTELQEVPHVATAD